MGKCLKSMVPVETDSEVVFYRYVDVAYAPMADEFGERRGSGDLKVELREYPLVRRTPKGVWIDDYGHERFVLLSARRKFACETKEDAMESFIARKRRQLEIYNARAERAKRAIRIARGESAVALAVRPFC